MSTPENYICEIMVFYAVSYIYHCSTTFLNMSKSTSKESDIALLSHIGFSAERHSVVDSACDARQNSSGSIPSRAGFLSAALSESSLQGTSIDLQSALTLLLSRMDKMVSNIVSATKTNNLLHERITDQEISVHPNSSEHEGYVLDEEVRSSSEELRPVNPF